MSKTDSSKTRKLTKREIESVKGGLYSVYQGMDPEGSKGEGEGTGKGDLPPF